MDEENPWENEKGSNPNSPGPGTIQEMPLAYSMDSLAVSAEHSRRTSDSGMPPRKKLNPSQKITNIQTTFSDSQKIAYVGLVYLSSASYKLERLLNTKRALVSYEKWMDAFMQRLYSYLDLREEEQRMIRRLAEHGLVPGDLSASLINDAKTAADKYVNSGGTSDYAISNNASEEMMDVRYAVLAHLYVLSITDGRFDSRARSVLRAIAGFLEIPYIDLLRIERTIAEQLTASVTEELRKDDGTVEKRNQIDAKGRWALAAAATLAGGAVIGLTAGLAAPLIGAGIGSALSLIGVSGAAGVGTFMGSAAGLALITTGGVLTGGGMSGYKMIKRTRGIDEFEFISLDDGLKQIAEHKEQRRHARRKRWRKEARERRELADQSKTSNSLAINTSNVASGINASEKSANSKSATSTPRFSQLPIVQGDNRRPSTADDVSSDDCASDSPGMEGVRGTCGLEHEETSTTAAARQTNVLVMIPGWISNGRDDFTLPFSTIVPNTYGDQYSLIWESKALAELGSTLKLIAGEITSFIVQQGLQATLLPMLMAGLAAPLWALKLTYFVDNPWGNGLDKAKKAGRVLADTLIAQVQGNRPVTLLGFSLGARVIFYCLKELAKHNAYGIVEDAYILGGPIIANKDEWEEIAAVCSGKITNGYLVNDWVLGYLYRASSALWKDVAGLNPIQGVKGVENIQLDDIIDGHLEYRLGMPKILQKLGFNVWRDYFDEEDEEEQKDQQEMEEELRKIAADKQRQRDMREKEKSAKKAAKKVVNEYSDGGLQIKELETTLPPLVLTKQEPGLAPITPATPALPRSSVGRSKGTAIND